jgi:hypothetical protein
MKLRLKRPTPKYAVMIPSAGRASVLFDTLKRQPFLNASNVYIGLQSEQLKEYRKVIKTFDRCNFVTYQNPFGSTCVVREYLRQAAVHDGHDVYICADDNTHYQKQSLDNLVRASMVYNSGGRGPAVVGGMQGSTSMAAKPTRFDEAYAKKSGHTIDGLRFYRKIGMMFWAFPHELYSRIRYIEKPFPPRVNPGAMEDHTAALGCLKLGCTTFVVCMDAPFQKKRFQKGGSGNPVARAQKIGHAWYRLGELYPDYMGEVRMVWPYAKFYKIAERSK